MSADEWLLLIEGSRYAWGTGGVSSISSYSDAAPTGTTIKRGYLQPIRSVISERLRPLDGNVEVSALDFVVHDTDGSGTDQFTRALDESALTFLTAPVLTSDTSITVANGAAITSFPTDVWINRECMRVTARAGNTLFVTRGYYGTAAEAIEVDAAQALQPELLAYPCTLRGRRARLYRVSGTTATLRWIGYVKNGPIVAANGASFVVQCAHVWEQEAASVWGNPRASAALTGYDSAAVMFIVENDNKSAVAYSTPPTYRAYVHTSRREAMNAALRRVATQLTSLGATSVFYTATDTGGEMLVVLRFGTFTLGRATLRYGGEEYTATSSDNSGVREHVWRIAVPDRGALVRTGFALGGDDRATVIRPHVGLTTTSWAAIAGSRSGVSITPVLVGELADDALLELDPTGQSTPGPVTNDSTFTSLAGGAAGATTFRAFARVIQRDPTARPEPISWEAHRAGLPIAEALPLYSAVRIDAEHWLDACRSLLEDDTYATSGSDSRNWSWSGYDAARAASRDDLGPVTYRTSGNVTVGDHIAGEARLRGGCVTVGSDARLGIIDLRSPTLTETPAATITVRDWVAGSTQSVAPSGDGLVTDVVFETPLRTMTLRDAVALGRYGTQSLLKVSTQSTRQDPRIADDPIGYSMLALGKLLGRWRDELFIYTGTVPADRYLSSCTLGAVVSFESNNAPNFRGGSKFSGSNAKRAVVVGRHEDPATNTLELELLALPVVYGFAPSARVSSIVGAKITLATGYLSGSATDYSGSNIAGYQGTANDGGASWFAAGYVCDLVLRDSATHTVDSFTVSSVNPATREITATAALPTVPTNWATLVAGGAIVDVVFASFGSTISTQRLFAVVADESTRKVSGSGTPRKWAP